MIFKNDKIFHNKTIKDFKKKVGNFWINDALSLKIIGNSTIKIHSNNYGENSFNIDGIDILKLISLEDENYNKYNFIKKINDLDKITNIKIRIITKQQIIIISYFFILFI